MITEQTAKKMKMRVAAGSPMGFEGSFTGVMPVTQKAPLLLSHADGDAGGEEPPGRGQCWWGTRVLPTVPAPPPAL